MCETSYEKLQSYSGEKKIPCHYMDTDTFVLSINSSNVIKDP